METLLQDLCFALRGLIRNPSFSVVAITSLGLGIGVNTAIFSSVYQVLMRPLPFHDPDRLVEVRSDRDAGTSKATLVRLWDRLPSFDDLAAWRSQEITLTGADTPERLSGVHVTANLHYLLGVEAQQGRTLMFEDGESGEDRVVVLSHGLWQRLYGEERDVVGRTMTLDGASHTIVGVMPKAFRLILAGLVVGVAGVVALTRLLTSQLYQVEPTDPMILASVILVLCAVGLVASYLPGRKASRLDPLDVLRGV